MKSIDQRLNNIIGQVEGIKRMTASKNSCIDILIQLKAIKSAIGGVMDMVVEDQIENCMTDLKKDQKQLLVKIKKYVKTN